ncbi:hypothetical protein BH10BDE1_BH10BDE1_22870 [soil metagenome]
MKFGAFSDALLTLSASIFLLITGGCANHDLRPSGLDSLISSEISLPRQPATSIGGAACFFERFKNPELIEIQNAESDSRALPEKVRGQRDKIYEYFKGRIGDFVHPKFQAALASCADPMCFYEKVYGRPLEGKLAYLFFLKTGMAVSATDAVPSVTSKPSETGAGIADFLFTAPELTMLIESSESITSPTYSFFVQPSLRTLHKVPTSTLANAESARVRGACGFANGTILVLEASCLRSDWEGKLKRNSFALRSDGNNGNDVFLHEFGHCVDFNLGKDGRTSARAGWTSLSSTIKPSADGVIHYTLEGPPGFVTGYAATSYMEDFAESFSHFRLRPDRTIQVAKGKHKFLREEVFQDRDFTTTGIRAEFANTINSKILEQMSAILAGCIGRPDAGRKPTLYKTENLAAAETACVEAEAVRIATEQFRFFQRTYPEGCLFAEAQWVRTMLAANADGVSKSIGSLENVRKLGIIREQMNAALDPKEAFLAFRKDANAKGLYRRALESNFEKFRPKFNELGAELGEAEQKNYLSRFDFAVVRDIVQGSMMQRLKEQSGALVAIVESSFQGCLKSARVVAPTDLLKRDFKPTSTSEFIECGRAAWKTQVPRAVAAIFSTINARASTRSLEYAGEVATLDVEDRFRQRTEEEVQKLEKGLLAEAAQRLNPNVPQPIPLSKILVAPVLEREDTCRGVLRKTIYDDVFRKSPLAAMLNYTQSLIALEDRYCEEKVDQNLKHRGELETFRNQAARIVYSLAFRTWPKVFPQDSTVFASKSSPVEVVDPARLATCQDDLSKALSSEPRLAAMLLLPAQARLVRSGVTEVCLNGRYAGRFVWMPTDHFVSYGGVRALGFAQFYTTPPTGGENRAYLYSLRRYIELRTAEKLDVRH